MSFCVIDGKSIEFFDTSMKASRLFEHSSNSLFSTIQFRRGEKLKLNFCTSKNTIFILLPMPKKQT